MKIPFIASLLTLIPAILVAAPTIKLELVGPKESVKIDQQQLDLVAALPETLKEYERLSQTIKPDRKAMQESQQAMAIAKSLKQGIDLTLRFTNTGKSPVEIQYGPDTSKNQLKVEGQGVVDMPFKGAITADYRMPDPTTIAPGETKEFTISELSYGTRDLSRWLVAKPGSYTATVTFTTTIKDEKIELTSNQVTFEVKAE
jgi:hypothetical protein